MRRFKLVRRSTAKFVSDRLKDAVEKEFNTEFDRYIGIGLGYGDDSSLRTRPGFLQSPYIDEWFDYQSTAKGMDYWSMANHLFTVEDKGI